MMHASITRLVLSAIAIAQMAMAASHKPWKGWTCDQMTPNLCEDLVVEIGILEIRGIPVKYWRYRRSGGSSQEEDPTTPGSSLSHPIIALHGGPSWPHQYLLPLRQLACRGAEVIFYDQAGCGESTLVEGESVPPSEHPHLLDPAYYSEEELPALIEHLGLDRYHILGHSWGTMLAQLYALNAKNTTGLQSLVLSGPLSDSKSYIRAQWDPREGNLGSLPPFVQDRLRVLEEQNAYDSEEYRAIADVLTTFFSLRTAPFPDCMAESAGGLNEEVYTSMQGPSEFTMKGVLGDFNVTGRLHEINIPVLLTHGKFDTMRPSIVKTMQQQLKIAERVLMPHSGHGSMIDDAGLMNDVVADFFQRVELSAGDRFVPKLEEGAVEDAVENVKIFFSSWVGEIGAFFVGIIIGRLGRGGNGGYARVY